LIRNYQWHHLSRNYRSPLLIRRCLSPQTIQNYQLHRSNLKNPLRHYFPKTPWHQLTRTFLSRHLFRNYRSPLLIRKTQRRHLYPKHLLRLLIRRCLSPQLIRNYQWRLLTRFLLLFLFLQKLQSPQTIQNYHWRLWIRRCLSPHLFRKLQWHLLTRKFLSHQMTLNYQWSHSNLKTQRRQTIRNYHLRLWFLFLQKLLWHPLIRMCQLRHLFRKPQLTRRFPWPQTIRYHRSRQRIPKFHSLPLFRKRLLHPMVLFLQRHLWLHLIRRVPQVPFRLLPPLSRLVRRFL
jgi:hypothetical protein